MKTIAIIGKNFGDEGKGLACASLSKNVKKTLVIKHNGGGQAGHTVELPDGRRFIHHQIGSGAEHGAATLIADTFYVDLYKLSEEIMNFKSIFGFTPTIYAEKNSKITIIDDVLRNMFIESSRGKKRHGSCGMGINECKMRHERGFSITLDDVSHMTAEEITKKLVYFRNKSDKSIFSTKSSLETLNNQSEYLEMLNDDSILFSFASYLKDGIKNIKLISATSDWLSDFDQIIFESGQGLLLDEDYEEYAPYLTPSKTGLHNVAEFLEKRKMFLDEVIYVTRSYVTRHGGGPLPCEVKKEDIPGISDDLTNIYNEWQGHIRYAKHMNIETFDKPVNDDIKSVAHYNCMRYTDKSLLITHLDETNDALYFENGDILYGDFIRELENINFYGNVYTSHSKYNMTAEKT